MKKTVVVIGATGDVGCGIVEVLLRRGHHVAAAARNSARLVKLLDELRHPDKLHAVPGSLDSDERAARPRPNLAKRARDTGTSRPDETLAFLL